MSGESATRENLTVWLHKMSQGDAEAADIVASEVYAELRRVARYVLSHESRHHSLQPTLIVNEAFLRLIQGKPINWADRGHFYAIASRMMRRIVTDYFRNRGAQKRPPMGKQIEFDESIVFDDSRQQEVRQVDEALTELSKEDERAARVVELRYFGGLTIDQTANTLQVSEKTVQRDWSFAKAWLRDFIDKNDDHVS